MYILTLHDGTQIEGLGLNGDCLISENPVDETLFEGVLPTVTISEGNRVERVYNNAVFVGQHEEPDGWYFAFIGLSQQELLNMELQAKLDYIAMMSDIDLED